MLTRDFKITILVGIFFRIFLDPLHSADLTEAVELASADSAEDAVTESLILSFKCTQESLHFLTLGVFIGGALGFYYGKIVLFRKFHYVLFGHI